METTTEAALTTPRPPSARRQACVRLACGLSVSLPLLIASLAAPARAAAPDQFFELKIRPVLAETCFRCHDDRQKAGGLRVDSRAALVAGGESGPAIVPGRPEESLLVQALRRDPDVSAMPPEKERALRPDQVADFERWIRDGAPWPEQSARFVGRRHWAFEPLNAPPLPVVADAAWCRTTVDRYIRAEQESVGVRPLAPADRRTLGRRAAFDLTGLPPDPELLEEFAADESPDALERLVDRWLAAPAYGERWGRHWLDVVRYADSAGETADYPLPLAWRYRNYVIQSFNRDKPYDEFVREQIAGDVLARESWASRRGDEQVAAERYAEQVTATGFLALSRRFGFDSENYHHLTIQDSIDTLGQSFLGLSLGCARCHDHKFDPITMRDYYALYGIFDSTRYPFPGSEQKQKVRSLAPLVPPTAAIPQWHDYLTRVGRLAHELQARNLPVPPGILRSLVDCDGDFELQAPAAGGSYGVLVPPWHYAGAISVTTAAQSPYKNLYASGRVGVSVPASTSDYRFYQSLATLQGESPHDQQHFNLDFRVHAATAAAGRGHGILLGDGEQPPALEWHIRGGRLEMHCGGVKHDVGPIAVGEWLNLQWTTDRRTSTLRGRFGKPGAATEFGPIPTPADVSQRWNRLEFRSLPALDAVQGESPSSAIDYDQFGVRNEPIGPASLEPASLDPAPREAAAASDLAARPTAAQIAQWNDELRRLVGIDGDLELQPLDKPPTAPWNPGPNSVVQLSRDAQSPYRNVYGAGKQGLRMPNRAEYDGFGVTLEKAPRSADGKMVVGFDFRCTSDAAGGDGAWRFYVGHGPGPSPAIELHWNAREFYYRDGDAKKPAGRLQVGRWYQVQLTLDAPARTYAGTLSTPDETISFAGVCPSIWDGAIDYSFIDSYGHLPGVRPSLDADNFAFVDRPLAPLRPAADAPTAATTERSKADDDAHVRRERIVALRKRLADEQARGEQLTRELQTLLVEGPFPMAYAMAEGTPHDAPLQQRGEPDRPGATTPRGFVKALSINSSMNSSMNNSPNDAAERPTTLSGSGRRELADWLTRPDQPLASRVMANRIWQYHFGRGLVVTPNDFGTRGQPPTHPALLDHLAHHFRRHDWSVKQLHRQIMLSATYRQSSPTVASESPAFESPAAKLTVDDARRLYVGFTRRRLSAEEIRDAILLVSGELDARPAEGHPFPSPITWGYSQHAPFRAVYNHAHRSVYLMSQRIKRHPFLALFDGADPNASTAERAATIVPTQALYFLNDPFVHESAERWAARLLAARPDDESRLEAAWRAATGRPATPVDIADAQHFFQLYRTELAALDAAQPATNAAAAEAAAVVARREQRLWAAYLRTLLGANEFLYVD